MPYPSLRAVAALAALASLPVPFASAQEDSGTHHRLFVGDHAEGVVRAIDLPSGRAAGTFRIDQTPALTASDSGRTVYAVQGEAGKVAAIATGVAVEDHGDHADLKVEAARLLPNVISGAKPAHIVEGSGTTALFDDGSGEVTLFAESALLGGAPEMKTLTPGAAHHGLAAPMGDFLVVSVADADPEKPRVGLKVVDREGRQVGETLACPGVHGQARSGRSFAFGCKDGIVLASPGQSFEPPTLKHLSTAALGEGNVSTLEGGTALRFFLGNYGPDAVVVIDPSKEDAFRKIDLPTRRIDFVLDPVKSSDAYVLTEDGELHRLDVLSGRIERSVRVTEPYSMDGHWREARPRLAMAGDHLAITDPAKGVVRLVSTERLDEVKAIPVDGKPYTIVAVGGSGATH